MAALLSFRLLIWIVLYTACISKCGETVYIPVYLQATPAIKFEWVVSVKSHSSENTSLLVSCEQLPLFMTHSLFFISGTDLFSSAAQTDFNMEKIHFKSSVATKPQTYFHSLASDMFCHALSLLFCALKRDLFFPYVFILLLMFHALPPFFHIVTLLFLKAHLRVCIKWCINKVDLTTENHVQYVTNVLFFPEKNKKYQVTEWDWRRRWIKQDRGVFSMQTSRFYY